MPGKRISIDLREKIIEFYQKGFGSRRISAKLMIPKGTVESIIKKFKKFGTVHDLPVSGKPRSTTLRMDRHIIAKVNAKPMISAPILNAEMKGEYGLVVSNQTIWNRIHEHGLKGRAARKKPFLSKRHIAQRLKWAKEHQSWTANDWKKVLWSDETKINLFGTDGVTRVWRRCGDADKTKFCRPTMKHGGGSRMVWACMSWKGVGNFEIIDGIMNAPY